MKDPVLFITLIIAVNIKKEKNKQKKWKITFFVQKSLFL